MNIGNVLLWSRFCIDTEYVCSGIGINCLKHRVILRLIACGYEHFYTRNAAEAHVLSNLNGIGAPGSNHLFARADKRAGEVRTLCQRMCISK